MNDQAGYHRGLWLVGYLNISGLQSTWISVTLERKAYTVSCCYWVMETEFISLFVLLFFGVNTALASPFMLQSIGSCDSFPNSLQLFCYKIENLWNNQVIATSDDNDNDKENSSVQLILGKETKNGRKKATGKHLYSKP